MRGAAPQADASGFRRGRGGYARTLGHSRWRPASTRKPAPEEAPTRRSDACPSGVPRTDSVRGTPYQSRSVSKLAKLLEATGRARPTARSPVLTRPTIVGSIRVTAEVTGRGSPTIVDGIRIFAPVLTGARHNRPLEAGTTTVLLFLKPLTDGRRGTWTLGVKGRVRPYPSGSSTTFFTASPIGLTSGLTTSSATRKGSRNGSAR